MAETSAIEWTDSTWNPVTGCTRVSPGCAHCYIETTIPFRTKHRRFKRVGNEETTGLILHEDRLDPKKVPKGPRIFVNSLSDLFHEEIPASFVDDVFQVMELLPDRTFQVLTKRPEYARELLAGGAISSSLPLPNVWLGVSIENARFTWRADVLREIPAAVRFISAEPLLGSLVSETPSFDTNEGRSDTRKPLDLTGIDWLIVGGESGGKFARPMHPGWARELRDACKYDLDVPDVAFFFKQWGSWAPVIGHLDGLTNLHVLTESGPEPFYGSLHGSSTVWDLQAVDGHGRLIIRYAGAGPKSGGNELDGRVWQEFPR